MGATDDLALVQAAQAGDLDAFGSLVRLHERRLRLVLLRLLDDERDAEEAVQDAFVKAWRNLHTFRGDAQPFTWLYRIAVNEALGRRRRNQPRTVELFDTDTAGSPEGQPEAHAEAADTRARILRALAALPDEHREAVVLRDIAGLANEDVAAALGISLAAAKSRIHRGRMQLRELLEPTA